MVDQQGSRPAVMHTTTPVITNSLYEAAFSTTGEHPQCGVALTRTIGEARKHLATMLYLCDLTAPATADIVEFTRAQTVSHYSGTVAEMFAQLEAEAPAAGHYTGTVAEIAAQINPGQTR